MAFYLIDKEAGVTSADVVREIKKKFDYKKVGHSGTLDPFATGLLIIATDGHTKLLSILLSENKKYTGKIRFNKTSETYDTESQVIESDNYVEIDEENLKIMINNKFIGLIKQKPPRFSSIKVDGKRAYELARENKEFDLPYVERKIYDFKIKKIEKDLFEFEVEVSSGTYIRSLARDLGESFNTVAMLEELRRISIGNNRIEDANTIENAKEISVNDVLNIESIDVSEEEMKNFMDGKIVSMKIDKPIHSFIARNKEKELLVTSKSFRNYKIKKRIK